MFDFSLFTAVEILGMSLTTDVQTSFDDPISKPIHSCTAYIYIYMYIY